ncbi:ribosomal protein S2, flavodoxin-like domain-containing protein [Peziza echinospora]|nr:ribosomal protein S2, flavodoxin-like domain-containing protein [Peziza echinospora]
MVIRQALTRQSRLLGSSGVRCFSRTSAAAQEVHLPSDFDRISPDDRARRKDWEQFQTFKSTTAKLGSKVTPHYQPSRVLRAPPAPQDITLNLLLASQAHLGHATSLWNPANQRYIFGVRQGIHIISLEIIAAHLRRAAKIVEGVAERGGLILFVGTRPGQERCIVEAAKLAGGCHLFERWIPGAITNSEQILGHGKVVEMDMRDRKRERKQLDKNDKKPNVPEQQKTLKPDLVICLNPLENYILLHECGLYAIPTIGIIDTDADPTWVTYPIPANDDSLRCVQLIAGILGRAGHEGKMRRLRRAEKEAYELSQRQSAEAKSQNGYWQQQQQEPDDIDLLYEQTDNKPLD